MAFDLVIAVIIGVALGVIDRFISMQPSIQTLLNVAVVVFAGIRILQAGRLWGEHH
jgi:hypothetical protein